MEYQEKFFKALHKLASESGNWSAINGKFASAGAAMTQHSMAMGLVDGQIKDLTKTEEYDYMELERLREEMMQKQRRLLRAAREYYAAQYLMSQEFDGMRHSQPFDRRELLRHIGHMHEELSGDWEPKGARGVAKRFASAEDATAGSLLLDCMRQAYGGKPGHFIKENEDHELAISVKAFNRLFEKEFGINLGPGEDWRRGL